MAAPTPIIPPDPIEANVDYRYDGCYQSMVLVLLQRIVDESDDAALIAKVQEIIDQLVILNGKVATETTLALVEAITSQMTFTGGDLNVNASVSLPAGLATEAKQDDQITLATAANLLLTSLDGKDFSTETTLAAIKAQTDLLNFTGAKLRTTGEDGGGGGGGTAPVLIFETTTPLGIAATFDSGVLSLVGKSQVETTVLADVDGTINIFFYSDVLGADLVRTLTIPYIGGSGFQYFAAPAFSQYVKYEFINGALAQTDFLYETKVLTTALSGQIVRLDGTIVNGMVAPINRSILTGIDKNGNYENVKTTPSGNLQVTPTDSETGATTIVDNNGSIKTAEVIVLSGGVLTGEPLSSFLWSELSINGGALTGGVGEQILSTGTSANGEFILQTKKRSRFIITQYNINHIGIQLLQLDLADPNTVFEWGSIDFIDDTGVTNILNPTPNGICFRVTGGTTPIWEIVSSKNGVETAVDSSLWNGPSAGNLNKTPDLSVYEMRYNAGGALFFQGPNFLHKLAGLVSTYAATYDFPVAIRIRNINGNTTDRKIASRASGAYRLGEERGELISRAFTVDTLIKVGAGYIGTAALSRTGSSGGSGTAEIYDGVDATGTLMGVIDVGGDDVKGISLNGTYSLGLYIEISGTGTNTLNMNFE
jgi:hypothetical protein